MHYVTNIQKVGILLCLLFWGTIGLYAQNADETQESMQTSIQWPEEIYRRYGVSMAEVTAPRTQNALFVEAFGAGFLYSLNYERRINDHLLARIGASTWRMENGNEVVDYAVRSTIFPITLALTFPRKSNMVELGGGISYCHFEEKVDFWKLSGLRKGRTIIGNAHLMLRSEPENSPFLLRCGFMTFFKDMEFSPWFGLSLGYRY